MIHSAPFRLSPAAYMTAITRVLITRRWWLSLAPAALIVWGAVADWRWAVVGLMLIFIIYPLAMSFTILRYATLPQIAARASATMADIDGDTVRLYRHTGDDTPPTCVAEARIISASHTRGMLRLATGQRTEDFIIIPSEALPAADFSDILRRFSPEESYDFSN